MILLSNLDLLIDNMTNPALLFFALGILSVKLKSDLEIPATSAKFISLYLLFSIGFKGGVELAHSEFGQEILLAIAFGIFTALAIPFYTFFLVKRRLGVENAGAIAAAYGSVSAVTFVTAATYLELQNQEFSGHMVAVMALMEAPAIVVGVMMVRLFGKREVDAPSIPLRHIVGHAFSNGSVLMILGSLVIGFLASDAQAQGIKPFTTDIFKGFLAIFLLEMGITSGRKLKDFFQNGSFALLFAVFVPLFNGIVVAYLSQWISPHVADRFMFAILAASASYIAVPAAMKIAVPNSNPGLYLPMALAITFPVNITIGMPIYYWLVSSV